MRQAKIICLLLMLAIMAGCSVSKQAYKEARKYDEAGLFVESAEQDLKALDKDPKFKEAKKHLLGVAPKAYDELMRRAQNLQQAENWDQAVAEYKHLDRLLSRCLRHGVVFETVNVKERLAKARNRAAAFHHKNAETLFEKKDWRRAAQAYLKAHNHVDNFKQSFDKAIRSYMSAGNQSLKERSYPAAIKDFKDALKVAPNHATAEKRLAESHYRLGRQFYDNGQFRQALTQLEEAERLNPDAKHIEQWADKAYEAAVQYVAVFPFVNRTRVRIDGNHIARALLTVLETRNLKFVDFMQHSETMALMNNVNYGPYGRISESQLREVALEEGLDSFVWGTILDISVADSPENMTEMTHEKEITVKDSMGKEVDTTETIYYREYSRERNVRVQMEHVILETQTGKILDRHRFTRKISDVAQWIAYQGSIYDLPKKKRALLDAPRNPRPLPALVDEMISGAVDKIGREVVKFYK